MNVIPQPRNFASHAIEALERLLRVQGKRTGYADILQVRASEAAEWLKKSIHFIGPPNGEFLDRVNCCVDDIDYPHLPFDVICLEYEYVLREVSARDGIRRAALEQQPDRVCVLAFYSNPTTPIGNIVLQEYGETRLGEFVVWPILGFKAGRIIYGALLEEEQWMPVLDPVLVTPEISSGLGVKVRSIDTGKCITVQVLSCQETLSIRAEASLQLGVKPSAETLLKEMTNDAAGEALAIVELCNLLDCTNVETISLAPSAKLNRKRVAAGRPPLFEYRVLNLRSSGGSEHENMGTSHASPRLHYRRGHIRRLQNGRKTWVRPHMVGDASRGNVVKDYKLSQAE